MANFMPNMSIPLHIRKIVFEKYNDTERHFTNNDIVEELRCRGVVKSDWTVNDIEPHIRQLCNAGMFRDIAQNLTTIWLKLFDVLEKYHCNSCGLEIFLGRMEERKCPNQPCSASI